MEYMTFLSPPALQSNLTDMNLILDSVSSGLTRQQLLNETQALRERNEVAQNQLEGVFRERQDKDEVNKELEQQIDNERRKINEMIYSLSPGDREKYFELQKLADNLRTKNADIHETIDRLTKQKEKMMASVLNSQSRMEAIRLQTRLHELTAKRNALHEEELNRMSPGQEREKLINEVRANNQALTSIGRQMKIIEDQLVDKKELLAQIEQDLEEGNSERHAKYVELKKRDEMMTGFLEVFPKNMQAEKQSE
jgi:intraflagellar transport protein 74